MTFLGNFVKDKFGGNFMGYKFLPVKFSEKWRFIGENR
jgi:hypothetical protein